MTLTSEQLAIRSKGIGASEIAAVVGIDPFRTAFDVWALKTNAVEKPPEEVWQRRGHLLEPVIAAMYQERHPERVLLMPSPATMVSPAYSWMLATPDRVVTAPDSESLLEAKSKRSYVAHDWGEDGDPEGVPIYVVAQCQWQLAVTGLARVDVGLLLDGEEYREYVVHRDDETIGALTEAGEQFWNNHVLQNVAPKLEGTLAADYLQQRFRRFTDVVAEASGEANEMMRELASVRARLEEMETLEKRLKLALQAEVADRKGIEGPHGRYTWSARKGNIDYKTAAFDLGLTADAAEKYRGETIRVPRFTPRGG